MLDFLRPLPESSVGETFCISTGAGFVHHTYGIAFCLLSYAPSLLSSFDFRSVGPFRRRLRRVQIVDESVWLVSPVLVWVFGAFPAPSFLPLWLTLVFSVSYCVVVAANRFLPGPVLLLTLSRECLLGKGLVPFDVDA